MEKAKPKNNKKNFTLFFKLNMEFLELTTYMLRLFYFVSLGLQ